MNLSQVNDHMAAFNAHAAPGSECTEWQDFCADCYRIYGCAGYSDNARDIEVSAEFAEYWYAL